MEEDVSINLRKFKKKLSVIDNARMIVTVVDTRHSRKLYSRFQGSNFELASIVADDGRPFMKKEKEALDKGAVRKQLAKSLKDYITPTENGLSVDWMSFSNKVQEVARDLLIQDKLGLKRLSPLTIQRKQKANEGSDTPLVATGQLADAIFAYPEYGE